MFDPASRLGDWLAKPEQARMLAQMARSWMLQALELLDEAAVRRAIHGFVVDRLRKWNAAATIGDIMALLTTDGRHQNCWMKYYCGWANGWTRNRSRRAPLH